MSDVKVLTKEIAEQWIADEDSVDLGGFAMIDDNAAESLSKYKGDLYFKRLRQLSDAAADIECWIKDQTHKNALFIAKAWIGESGCGQEKLSSTSKYLSTTTTMEMRMAPITTKHFTTIRFSYTTFTRPTRPNKASISTPDTPCEESFMANQISTHESELAASQA